jgi:hypothetical protein
MWMRRAWSHSRISVLAHRGDDDHEGVAGAAAGDADCVLLQRACGCTGEEECDECEGVRVTLCNSSSLPVVTTPGPKPKRLTLDDLKIPGGPSS